MILSFVLELNIDFYFAQSEVELWGPRYTYGDRLCMSSVSYRGVAKAHGVNGALSD